MHWIISRKIGKFHVLTTKPLKFLEKCNRDKTADRTEIELQAKSKFHRKKTKGGKVRVFRTLETI